MKPLHSIEEFYAAVDDNMHAAFIGYSNLFKFNFRLKKYFRTETKLYGAIILVQSAFRTGAVYGALHEAFKNAPEVPDNFPTRESFLAEKWKAFLVENEIDDIIHSPHCDMSKHAIKVLMKCTKHGFEHGAQAGEVFANKRMSVMAGTFQDYLRHRGKPSDN